MLCIIYSRVTRWWTFHPFYVMLVFLLSLSPFIACLFAILLYVLLLVLLCCLYLFPRFCLLATLVLLLSMVFLYEPLRDKTNSVAVRPTKAQISLGIRPVWSESSLSAHWVAKDPSFPHADSEDWSDWADAQADLSFSWAHSLFVGFVMLWLILICILAMHVLHVVYPLLKLVENLLFFFFRIAQGFQCGDDGLDLD